MRNSSPASGTTASGSSEARPEGQGPGAATETGQVAREAERAALGPSAEPVSAAENPLPPRPAADSPAEAQGRRILSTAYVMVGPDGLLTVRLRDGRELLLRNAVLRPKDFCGALVHGGKTGAQYCGGYAEVAAARPSGVPAPE